MARWSTLLLDQASLAELPRVPLRDVMRHADLVATARLKPNQLYQRWEAQQWSAEAIELGPDRDDFAQRLPRAAKSRLTESIATFIVGEYTGVDLLAPLLTGAPDEAGHLYLGTQIADEARHTRLMLRLGQEILDLDSDPRVMLSQAWNMVTPAHRDLILLETQVIGELLGHPGDYRRWLRGVALFHLITEGVLALVGQRQIVTALRAIPFLDGVKATFVAMCRDESRHVSYGLHALRQGVREGYGDDIREIVEQAAPIALQIGESSAFSTSEMQVMHRMSIDALRRQLRRLGIDQPFIEHVVRRSAAKSATSERTTPISEETLP